MADATMPPGKASRRWVYLLGVLVTLAYAIWMIGPYVRSVIVRDAAVTSWSNMATAPIDGRVEFVRHSVENVVGPDGIIVRVTNDQLHTGELTNARFRVNLARIRVAELQVFLDEVKQLDQERAGLKGQYAKAFREELDADIASLKREFKVTSDRLELMRKIAARHERLADKGTGSQNAADEAGLRVSDTALKVTELRGALVNAQVRRRTADNGVFITAAGDDPDWVRGSRMELKLQKKQARMELKQAQSELDFALEVRQATEEEFRRLSKAVVVAPPGSIIWSQHVAPSATVEAGTPVAQWLDCSVLMVDVPVSDAEVPLIKPGMPVEVILEGESEVRQASVLLTRGAASTLGSADLIAVAKGRGEGGAQVLLDLSQAENRFDHCPVGRAAYVDFPEIGLIDVIRARLRL